MTAFQRNIATLLFFSHLLAFCPRLQGQEAHLIGFRKETGGTNFTYHSPFSNREGSLLSRARESFPPIEWETDPVPSGWRGETVSFTWAYGMDVLPDAQHFDLYVDGEKLFRFSNPVSNEPAVWSVYGKNGAKLTFNRSMIDKHKDQMGFAVLTLPRAMVTPGKPLRIKVDGDNNQSDAWYMTFKIPLEEQVTAAQLKTVTKQNGALFHTVRLNFIHLNDPVTASAATGSIHTSFTLQTGLNEVDLLVPAADQPTRISIKVVVGAKPPQYRELELKPVKEWTLYLVQHTHTDIGYTRPQTEILAEHLRYIDDALDYCDQTDHFPKEAQFRWTCEAAWTVREYLKNRPKSQIDRLLNRIREGRIEVTGMFFNFTEIVDETALAIQTQTLKRFKAQGIDVTAAMQNDVNGIGWCMIDLYHNTGVKYLTMGQHGHRAHVPFDKPTAFWWESPAGNRLLAYRSEHYMHGNALSLTSGDLDVFRSRLSEYLDQLEAKNYPYDRTAFQFSGYVTDNSPPSATACNIVKAWNEKYEWPKLKLALASEFMVYLEQNQPDQLETKRAAWPDWWSDGVGTAMNETKTARTTHADMIANLGLLAMARLLGAEVPNHLHQEIETCFDNLLFYDEHTFGAAESISDPTSANSVNQWQQKSAYVWSAAQQSGLLREKALGLIQPYVERSALPSVAVFNTLNWSRSGVAEVFIDHDILPLDKAFAIRDAAGKTISAQLIRSRSEGSYWALWVENVPPMGYATFTLHVSDQNPAGALTEQGAPAETLENDFYQLRFDRTTGGISSLYDKQLRRELIDPESPEPLGGLIYEQPENRHSMERLTNDHRDTVYVPLKKTMERLTNITLVRTENGPVWQSLLLNGQLPGCADERGVNLEIRLYHHAKKLELRYDMRKLAVTSPEGLFVPFPFTGTRLAFEAQGGTVYPGINQLEGTSADWNTIQNFAAALSDTTQIILASNDVPLVQFGDINTGRFYYRYRPLKPHLYSWVLNNYWTTNFRASQEGELTWRYALTSDPDNSNTVATRFGWGDRIPLPTRVIPAGNTAGTGQSTTLLDLHIPNLLLVNARPTADGNGVLLHLRETEGDHAVLDIPRLLKQTGAAEAFETNVLGDTIQPLNAPILIEHFETKFILLKQKE